MPEKPNDPSGHDGRKLLESYMRQMTGVLSPRSLANYHGEIEKYMASIGWDVSGISLATASEYVTTVQSERLMAKAKEGGTQTVSIATRNRRVAALHSFVEWLHKTMGMFPVNPLEDLRRGKLPQRLPKFLTDEEMRQLLDGQDTASHEGMRDRALLEFLYCTGCRIQEVADLTWDMVDMRNATVKIIGKGDKERRVYLSDECLEWLWRYKDYSWKYWQKHAATHFDGMNHVFTNENFLPVNRCVMYNWVTAAGRKAKLKKHLHPHLLRHTFGTKMVRDGANVVIVKDIMGHTSLSTTQIYVAVTEGDKQDAVRNVFNRKAE